MMKGDSFLTKSLTFLFLAVLIVMAYYYWQGANSSIDWKITTHAEPTEFSVHNFQKGPFQFSISGYFYSLTESFSAGPIERYFARDTIFLILTWIGICLLITLATYLSRMWFTGISGLFIFLIINLKFASIEIFGFGEFSYWGNIILIALFIAPAYVFQAYFKYTPFLLRLTTFLIASIAVATLGAVELVSLQEQLNVGLYFSMIVLMLLFLIIVAEENVFAILFLITKNRGGEHNEKHFSVFSLIYLGLLVMVYGKKAGFIRTELPFFDPYVLLIISSLVALWSLKHKSHLYRNLLSQEQALQFFVVIGVVVFSYLALAFSRGNDPVFEGLHYFIIYTHLAFGILFFIYTFMNFFNPLMKGHQVYKIVYRERNFPYVTARLAGLVVIAAVFLYSDKEAFKLFRAGHFNYMGEQAELDNEKGLANQYYIEGSIYGHDNHFSNYKIAYGNLQKGKTEEANYKFGRATLRYPTPHAYINQSSTYSMLSEVTLSTVSLQAALKKFAGNNIVLNNLGLIYTDLGNVETAGNYFRQAGSDKGWNNANEVNLWRIGLGEDGLQSFNEGNTAVKSNVIANALAQNESFDIAFDARALNATYPLHADAFLINSVWYFGSEEAQKLLNENIQNPVEEGLYENSLHALAWSAFKNGNINQSLKKLDQLTHQTTSAEKGKYLNQMGLIALEQQSPALALGFFEEALASGNKEAYLNKAVALLEKGDFESALSWMGTMAEVDSTQQDLAADFQMILNGDRLTEEQKMIKVYYQYPLFSLAEMSVLMPAQNLGYVKNLWNKISREVMETGDFDLLEDYLSIFRPLLDEADYQDCLAVVALRRNLNFSGTHPIAVALNSSGSTRNELLFEEADKNALNTTLVIAVAKYLESTHIQQSYDLLVESIDINPDHIGLLKAYALAALEINLIDYAAPVLRKLSGALSTDEFSEFQAVFESRKMELEESEW